MDPAPLPPVLVRIDSRLRLRLEELPPEVVAELKAQCTHVNPKRHKLERASRGAKGKQRFALLASSKREPEVISTWGEKGGELTLPRGALSRVRGVLVHYGLAWRYEDVRSRGGKPGRPLVHRPDPKEADGGALRWYQEEAVEACVARQNCLLRAPTGSGKTSTLIGIIARLGVPVLVVVDSAELMRQWLGRLRAELGLREDEVGVIGAGRWELKFVTVGMRQTLARRLYDRTGRRKADTIEGYFGAVVVDECLEGSTSILMADGGVKPICEVREGEEVAVGGRVRAVFRRWYEGEFVGHVLDGWCTAEHPVAVDGVGWVSAGLVRSGDVLWGDADHEVRPLRQASEESQQPGEMQEAREGVVRLDDWTLLGVRRVSSEGSEGVPCNLELRDEGAVEQGTDGGDECRGEGLCRHHEGEAEARSGRSAEAALGDGSARDDAGSVTGAAGSVRAARAAGEVEGAGGGSHRGGEGCTVRWSPVWQREAGDGERAEAGRVASGPWVCAGVRRGDREEGIGVAGSLQDRCREPGEEGCCRARWEQSSNAEEAGGRSTQGLLPRVEGVVGVALPGAGRLSRYRAAGSRIVRGAAFVWNLETEGGVYVAGGTLVHNCHRAAAATFRSVIDRLPCFWRIGASADETRKDQLECLVYDTFGGVAHEVSQAELIEAGAVLDVECLVVPTSFRADWYVQQMASGMPDFNRLLDEMTADPDRNALLEEVVRSEAERDQVLLLTHRVEHARALAQTLSCGLMLGGVEWAETRARAIDAMRAGSLRVGCGTVQSMGTGVDLPSVAVGVLATPVGNNRQLYAQIRGRLCRPAEGKRALLYVLWDQHVSGMTALKRFVAWNHSVVVRDATGAWVEGRAYLKGKG